MYQRLTEVPHDRECLSVSVNRCGYGRGLTQAYLAVNELRGECVQSGLIHVYGNSRHSRDCVQLNRVHDLLTRNHVCVKLSRDPDQSKYIQDVHVRNLIDKLPRRQIHISSYSPFITCSYVIGPKNVTMAFCLLIVHFSRAPSCVQG